MNKWIILVLASIFLTGCAGASKYPKTGDRKIDAMMTRSDIDDETKREILHAYHMEKIANRRYTKYRPVVDPSICQDCDYERDLLQCGSLADSNSSLASGTLGGAAAGAGLAAAIGAVAGVDPGLMAASGATGGAIGGAGNEVMAHRQMIARCMTGRGYSVLR